MNITGMLPQVNCLSFLEAKSDLQTLVSGGQITAGLAGTGEDY
jgi:hypothetical protein